MLNQVSLIGNLGKDIELRHTDSGQAVATLRLATSRTWKDKQSGEKREETEWHDVELWGKTAEACEKHLGKGSRIFVQGRLKTDRWEKDGAQHSRTKVVAEMVKFLGGKGAPQSEEAAGDQAAA